MSKPTFLLGLGTQKAGTSWLQAYLANRDGVDFGPLKEYHTFDAMYLPTYSHVLDRRDPSPWRKPRKFFSYIRRYRKWPADERLRRQLRSEGAYHSYFMRLLDRPGIWMTGDITPDYAGLNSAVLVDIRKAFEAGGVDVKAVFLARDPVERCISAVRMYRGRTFDSHRLPISNNASTEESVKLLYSTPHFEALTRYDITISEAEESFEKGNLHTAFYEALFSLEEVGRIDRFLGLPEGAPDLNRRVNASGFKDEQVSDDLKAQIAKHYRPVYEEMFRRFGKERIGALWPSASLIT